MPMLPIFFRELFPHAIHDPFVPAADPEPIRESRGRAHDRDARKRVRRRENARADQEERKERAIQDEKRTNMRPQLISPGEVFLSFRPFVFGRIGPIQLIKLSAFLGKNFIFRIRLVISASTTFVPNQDRRIKRLCYRSPDPLREQARTGAHIPPIHDFPPLF